MFIADVIALDTDSITVSFLTNEKVRIALSRDQIEALESARTRSKASPDIYRDVFAAVTERIETWLKLAPWADDEEARKAWLALEPASICLPSA